MKIGDTVRVVGSSILGDMGHLEEVFTITAEVWGAPEKHFPFSPYDGSYFSESSLELEEAGIIKG
jgi:hypothetical protein